MKKNGQDAKEISLIGQGFQGYIDHLFWFIPFSNPKQAYEMLAKKEMSDEPCITKCDEVRAKHLLEQGPADLTKGWKAWLAANSLRTTKEGPVVVPAAGVTSKVRK